MSLYVKCIFWQIWTEIVENQDLYRNKNDYLIFFKWKINNTNSVAKVDYRGAAAPKKILLGWLQNPGQRLEKDVVHRYMYQYNTVYVDNRYFYWE